MTNRKFILGIFVLYSLSLFGEFQFDDYSHLHAKAFMGQPVGIPGRLLPTLLIRGLYSLVGLNPMLFKCVNIVLHCSVVAMLFTLAKQLGRSSWGVVVFAIHPVFVSTVAYPIQASVMMATLLCGCAFISYLRKNWCASVILFACACLCKQNAWVFPAVVFVYEWLVKRKLSIAWLLMGGAIVGNWYVLTHDIHTLLVNRLFSPWTRICTQGFVWLKYCGMVLFPWKYTICHEVEVIHHAFWLVLWLVVILALLYVLGRKGKCIVLAFVIMMLPESSGLSLDLCFEHRLYFPCAILAMGVPRVRWDVVYTLMFAWLLVVNLQTQWVWLSQRRMWEHTLEMYPKNWRAHNNLAKLIYFNEPILALHHFNEAVKIDNRKTQRWHNEQAEVFKYVYADKINGALSEFDKNINKERE